MNRHIIVELKKNMIYYIHRKPTEVSYDEFSRFYKLMFPSKHPYQRGIIKLWLSMNALAIILGFSPVKYPLIHLRGM